MNDISPLSANPTKWSNTLKQFVVNLPTNCLSVFGHFVGLALKGLVRDLLHNYLATERKLVLTFCCHNYDPTNICLFKVNHRNNRERYEIVKVNNKDTRTMSVTLWCFYC